MLSAQALRICELLVRASEIALEIYDAPDTEIKADRSVVTKADKAVEDMLVKELEDLSAGIHVIGEETSVAKSEEYLQSALCGKTYIVDPIDGTALYACHIPLWGTSIGYAENGKLLEGGIVCPLTGEMMISDNGVTYYTGCSCIHELKNWKSRLKPLAPPPGVLDGKSLLGLTQSIARFGIMRERYTVNASGSTIHAMFALATGRYAGLLSYAKLWDYAGSLPCLKNLGFHCVSQNGVNALDMEINSANYAVSNDAKVPFLAQDLLCFAPTHEIGERLSNMYYFPEGVEEYV